MIEARHPPCAPLCDLIGGDGDLPDEEGRAAGFVWTVLPRHGRRPAAFLGRELLRADNAQAVRAGLRSEWSDIRIFELADAGFVTSVRHLRAEDGLPRWQDAWRSTDASAVVAALCAHDPDMPGEASQVPAWHDLLQAIFGAGPRA
jgi:hypothetical protein